MENENNNQFNDSVTVNDEVSVAPVENIPTEAPEVVVPPVENVVEVTPEAPVAASEPVVEATPVTPVTPQPVQEQPATAKPVAASSDNGFYEKEKKKWPIVLLVVVLVLVGAFAYYYFVMTSPSNIVKKLLNGAYKDVSKASNKLVESGGEEITNMLVDSTLTFTSTNEQLKSLSGLNAKLKVGYDMKDQDKNIIDADIKLQDSSLMNVAVTLAKGNMYLDLKDAYDKTVYMKNDETLIDTSDLKIDDKEVKQYVDDILYLIQVSKDALLNNITKEKLNRKIMFKDIDGKKVPVVEVTYEVDFPEYKKLHNGVINAILNDDKAIMALTRLSDEDSDSIKEELKDEIENLSELDFDNINVTIDVDAITNKLVNLNLKDKDNEINYLEKSSESVLKMNMEGTDEVNVTFDKTENKVIVDAKVTTDEETYKVSLTVKADEVSKTEAKASVVLAVYGPNELSKEMMNVTADVNVKVNTTIQTVDIANAVDMSSLSGKEAEQFSSAYMSAFGILGMLGA